MATGQLIFQPPKFDWHVEDQQLAFEEWKGQVILALEASNIDRERWYATIVGFLGKRRFQMVEQSSHFKAGRKQKEPQQSLQGYH